MGSYFFIGVAGAGMSAIAQYLSGKGHSVSGSDRQFNGGAQPPVRLQLEQAGIRCFANDGTGVPEGLDAVVVSTAIEESNPDLAAAKARGAEVIHRSEMLGRIADAVRCVAVSGTSGKSTVAGMTFHILEEAGLSPSLITGAGLVSLERKGLIGNGVAGRGEWLVIEADESDGSLVRYHPEVGVALNVTKDHKPVEELMEIFGTFAAHVAERDGTLVANAAQPELVALSKGRLTAFGTDSIDAQGRTAIDLYGDGYAAQGHGISFSATSRKTGETVRFTIPFPGRHTMENALAATGAALCAGVSLKDCAKALATFPGIHRRHQILGTFGGVTVVDDFAHNPSKIAASIRSVQGFTSGKVIAWFQPHGFGPTRFLRRDIVDAVSDALRPQDRMFFSQIYYAGGTVVRDIASSDLADDLAAKGVAATCIDDRDACADAMASLAQSGDTILLMGARDPTLGAFARSVADRCAARQGAK